jgi:two-component sensor histidine kinase
MIAISLSAAALHRCVLVISDNGIGIPPQRLEKKSGSLGLSLIEALASNLDGSLSIENNGGTIVRITFVREPVVRRPRSLVHPN